jgi:hypothetical protein
VRSYRLPDLVDTTGNGYFHKSGMVTGTTTGERMGTACGDFLGSTSITTPPSQILYECVTLVTHAGWGLGDSGAAVFGQQVHGGPYHALGIQVVAQGMTYTSGTNKGKCIPSPDCRFGFHQWSNIEARFNIRLRPNTVLTP